MTRQRLWSEDEFAIWLTDTCQRQGVPVTITDPHTVTKIAVLFGRAAPRCMPNTRTTTQANTSVRHAA